MSFKHFCRRTFSCRSNISVEGLFHVVQTFLKKDYVMSFKNFCRRTFSCCNSFSICSLSSRHSFVFVGIPDVEIAVFCCWCCCLYDSQGDRGTYRAPPPPPPQEPSAMVPKCTLGCPEHNLTCSPESHWDALEL